MKQVARIAFTVVATLAVLVALWQMRIALVLFFLSLAVAAALRPVKEAIQDRGLSPAQSLIVTYAAAVLGVAAGLSVVTSSLFGEVAAATDALARAYERARTFWPLAGTPLERALAAQLPDPDALYDALAGAGGAAAARTVLGAASSAFGLLGELAVVLIGSLYWSIDRERFERLWLSMLTGESRTRARGIWRSVEVNVGSYIRREGMRALLTAALLWLGYRALGAPHPTLTALLGALIALVPWVGPVLALVAPLVEGVVMGLPRGWAVVAYSIVVLGGVRIVLRREPLRGQRTSSILIALAVIVLAHSYGLLGAILAPPLAVAVQILFSQLTQPSTAPSGLALERLLSIERRWELLRPQLGEQEQLPPAIASMAGRLDALLVRARDAVEDSEATFGGGPIAAKPVRDAPPTK